MQHIGNNIKAAIEKSNLSVTEVAKRLNTSYQNLYRIFSKKSVETRYLFELSEILNVPITVFIDHNFPSSYINDQNEVIKKYEKRILELENQVNELKAIGTYIKAYYEYQILLMKKQSEYLIFKEPGMTDEEAEAKMYSDPEIIRLQKEKDEFLSKWAFGKMDIDFSKLF